MKTYKQIIASFLLILFVLIQLVDLHELNHDQGDKDCTICKLASENLHNHFIPVEEVLVPEAILISCSLHDDDYVIPEFSRAPYSSFLNKAPPVV